MKRILIVGAGGQIGSELTTYLREIYGDANVIATDVRECPALAEQGRFRSARRTRHYGHGFDRVAIPHRHHFQPRGAAVGRG